MHYHVKSVKYGAGKERETEHRDSADFTDTRETRDFLSSVLHALHKIEQGRWAHFA